jgi:type IV fimbrial biogenesis protein FimT
MCVPQDIFATGANLQCATSGTEWNSGWIIFSNPKCDSKPEDTTAELIKAYVGDPSGPSLKGTGTPISLRFDSSGRLSLGAPASFSVSPPGEAALKMVCLDMMGRTRIGNVGSISCDGSNQN